MPKILKNIKKNGYWIFWFLVVFILVSFTKSKQKERICNNEPFVHIEYNLDNYFIEKNDVVSMMKEGNRKVIKGLNKEAIDLKYYEELVEKNSFVQDVQIAQMLNGDIYVRVVENEPIARIFDQKGSYYIDKTGKKLKLSKKYTSRNLVIRAEDFPLVQNQEFFKENGRKYMELIAYINQNEFWSKQISEVKILKNGKVELSALIGNQKIIFGEVEAIDKKFKKLEVFFKKILPSVGWNKYKIVNLEFKQQIVCE